MNETDSQSRVWKALADPTRRGLLDLLHERARTTGELCDAFPELGRTTVMKHLGVLEGVGLVLVRREGRQRWNYANPVPIQEIYDRWMSRHVAQRTRSVLALRAAAERRGGGKAGE